jgi:hypothetical protein
VHLSFRSGRCALSSGGSFATECVVRGFDGEEARLSDFFWLVSRDGRVWVVDSDEVEVYTIASVKAYASMKLKEVQRFLTSSCVALGGK